jgi:hypothetical protein
LATGSALQFDGTNFSVGASPNGAAKGYFYSASGDTRLYVANSTTQAQFACESGGNTVYLGSYSNSPVLFRVNDSEKMRLTTAGYLGIGTSSPNTSLHVVSGNTFAASFQGASSTNFVAIGTTGYGASINGYTSGFASAADLVLQPNGGNVGLGITPSAWGSQRRSVQVGYSSALTGVNNDNVTWLSTNAYNDGSIWKRIKGGVPQLLECYNGGFTFYNDGYNATPDSTITFSATMTLDNSGNLLVGTTSQIASCRQSIVAPSNGLAISVANGAVGSYMTNTSGTGNWQPFSFNVNGTSFTQVGSITITSSTTQYNITSDQRLKTNIVDAPDGNIDQIKIRSFDWKADNSHNIYGVIAQELLEVAPYAVHQPENQDEMMGVDYSKLVPMMIKEIQSLKAEVAKLKGV